MTAYCQTCPQPLDQVAILCGEHTCTDCECKRIQPRTSSEWAIFRAALREAATNGVVHQAAVRPLISGRIPPKHIGQLYVRAKREGLLRQIAKEPSADKAGRNGHHESPVYALERAA